MRERTAYQRNESREGTCIKNISIYLCMYMCTSQVCVGGCVCRRYEGVHIYIYMHTITFFLNTSNVDGGNSVK